jgi:hypothetical protein
MSQQQTEEHYKRAVQVFNQFKEQTINKLKEAYPDAIFKNEGEAINHLIDKGNRVEEAVIKFYNLFPDNEASHKAKFEWGKFTGKNLNTEFLEKEVFELFFDNEFHLILGGGRISGLKGIESSYKLFLRLHEIYEQRFNNNEIDETEKLTNFERLFWFRQIGGFELPVFKNQNLTNINRDKIISKVLKINTRDIKSFINEDTKNPLKESDKVKISNQFNTLTKGKGKK